MNYCFIDIINRYIYNITITICILYYFVNKSLMKFLTIKHEEFSHALSIAVESSFVMLSSPLITFIMLSSFTLFESGDSPERASAMLSKTNSLSLNRWYDNRKIIALILRSLLKSTFE